MKKLRKRTQRASKQSTSPTVPAAKKGSESRVETHHIVLPSHTNAIGTIFGGTLMSWIDIAAAICAQRHSGKVCVTASVDALNFRHPVRLGDTVKLSAKVVYTGRTSMVVTVKVSAENPRSSEVNHCVDALLTFVGLDSSGKPVVVPPLKLTTAQEKKEFRIAAKRREVLLSLRS